MNNNNGAPFLSGLIFGLAAGAVAGILLAPKSGAETREDIKNLAIDIGEKATHEYNNIKAEVQKRLLALKEAGKSIDWNMYKAMVQEVVDEFKNDGKVTAEVAKKMGTQLGGDWELVKSSLV